MVHPRVLDAMRARCPNCHAIYDLFEHTPQILDCNHTICKVCSILSCKFCNLKTDKPTDDIQMMSLVRCQERVAVMRMQLSENENHISSYRNTITLMRGQITEGLENSQRMREMAANDALKIADLTKKLEQEMMNTFKNEMTVKTASSYLSNLQMKEINLMKNSLFCRDCGQRENEKNAQICKSCYDGNIDEVMILAKNSNDAQSLPSTAICPICAIRKHVKNGHEIMDYSAIQALKEYISLKQYKEDPARRENREEAKKMDLKKVMEAVDQKMMKLGSMRETMARRKTRKAATRESQALDGKMEKLEVSDSGKIMVDDNQNLLKV